MDRVPFALLEGPETRKPSKVRLVFFLLFLLLLILSVVFLSLYVIQKSKSPEPGRIVYVSSNSSSYTTSEPMTERSKKTEPTTSDPTTFWPTTFWPTTLWPTTFWPTTFWPTTFEPTTFEPTAFEPPTFEPTTSDATTSESPTSGICTSSVCVTSAADILSKLDESTKPCDDFYQYSCGGFLKKTFLQDGQGQVGADTALTDYIQNSLKKLLENEELISRDPKSAVYKASSFYKSCMNESVIKNAGVKPILDLLERYGSWNITNENWTGDSWQLEKILARVLVDLQTPAFVNLNVATSFFDTSKNFIMIGGGFSGRQRTLTKPDKNPSRPNLRETSDFADLDEGYKKFMSTVFELLGAGSSTSEEVEEINQLEHDFIQVKEYVDPWEHHKWVEFKTLEELNIYTFYKFNWRIYLEEVFRGTGKSIRSDQKLMILQPYNLKKIVDFITSKPKRLLANEIMWNAIRGLIETLPEAFRDAHDKYIEDITKGGWHPMPRWRTCNRLTDKALKYVTSSLYVKEHLSDDALKAAGELFTEIKDQFVEGLNEQTWMDYSTRAQARLKLNHMKENIGYPSFIKDEVKLNDFYKNVEVNISSLLQNQLSSFQVQMRRKLDALGKTPDDKKFAFSPITVNAYYNRRINGMTILAGILQPPYYVHGRLNALNYGSLGMVIGHEITHGFDAIGRLFDEKGNVRSWWSEQSRLNFKRRASCLTDQYNKVTVYGEQADGNKTLSENIADNGGLKYAFKAYQKWRETHGDEEKLPALPFNNDQLFFIGFAQLWCEKYTVERAKLLKKVDVHSLDPVRVRVPLHNFPEFSKAFGCPVPTDRCAVW